MKPTRGGGNLIVWNAFLEEERRQYRSLVSEDDMNTNSCFFLEGTELFKN